MKTWLNDITNLLINIQSMLAILVEKQRNRELPLKQRRRWTKEELLEELKMSEATYNRHLKKGILVPMRLSGTDMYYEEDIVKALEESRRRGRI